MYTFAQKWRTFDPVRSRPAGRTMPPAPVEARHAASAEGAPAALGHDFSRVPLHPASATGEENKPETIGSEEASSVCVDPCGRFPWFEVAPDRFFALCDDAVKMAGPVVQTVGCPPQGSGAVVFVSGTPAWTLDNVCDACTAPASKNKPMPKVEIGYIQTVEKVMSGGVYYKQNAAGKWEWSGNEWLCASNARDGHKTSTAPWYGPDPSGNFGPVRYPGCPNLADNPLVKLPSHKHGGTLRRMRIDGVFHIWLIAKPAVGPVVFIHHWDIAPWVVTELADNGHPCSNSAWSWKFNGTRVTGKGPGKGSATPVLTGRTANTLKKPC